MKRRTWLTWEVEFLRRVYADHHTHAIAAVLRMDPKRVTSKAQNLGLHKSHELVAHMAREAMRRPDHGVRAHSFAPGHVPWNKGTRFVAGGRSAETRFRPGNHPHTWVPVGTLRIHQGKNGGTGLQRKVADDAGPKTARWKPVARIVWEDAQGPVPPDHIVVFRPILDQSDKPAGLQRAHHGFAHFARILKLVIGVDHQN